MTDQIWIQDWSFPLPTVASGFGFHLEPSVQHHNQIVAGLYEEDKSSCPFSIISVEKHELKNFCRIQHSQPCVDNVSMMMFHLAHLLMCVWA